MKFAVGVGTSAVVDLRRGFEPLDWSWALEEGLPRSGCCVVLLDVVVVGWEGERVFDAWRRRDGCPVVAWEELLVGEETEERRLGRGTGRLPLPAGLC